MRIQMGPSLQVLKVHDHRNEPRLMKIQYSFTAVAYAAPRIPTWAL